MNIDLIKRVTEEITGHKVDDQRRNKEIVVARNIYFKICRDMTGHTLHAVGQLAGRHYATVLHGIEALEGWMENEPGTRALYERVKRNIPDDLQAVSFNNSIGYYLEENKRLNNIIADLWQSNQLLREKVYGSRHNKQSSEVKEEMAAARL